MDYFNMENRNIESLINTEAEAAILGTFIVNEKSHNLIDDVEIGIFSDRTLKTIFKSIKYLKDNDKEIDIIGINQVLKEKGINIPVSQLTNLTNFGNIYNLKGSIETLKELYVKRNIYEKACKLAEGVLEGEPIDSLMNGFDEYTKAMEVSEDYDDSIQGITERLFDKFNSKAEKNIEFGINVLDKTIGGLFPTELTTIGAKSGVGKTALALFIAKNVIQQGKKVLIITREMTDEHITQRLITQKTAISSNKMKKREFTADEWTSIISTLGELNGYNLHINDKIGKISQIRKRIRDLKPDLVIVDYLQLLTSEENTNNREREVATLSRGMKELAQTFRIPVIQLTQLNDAFAGRPFGESAVRESKAIYQDSNNVIYIHKPINEKDMEALTDPLLSEEDRKRQADMWLDMNIGDSPTKVIEMIVSKSRDGGTAIEKMWYSGQNLSYLNWNLE